jgi:hypothetical protein
LDWLHRLLVASAKTVYMYNAKRARNSLMS